MHKPQFSLALVTGASSGIGEALCRLLAANGVPMLIVARDKVRLDKLAEELRNVAVTVLSADLGTEAGRKSVVDAIRQKTRIWLSTVPASAFMVKPWHMNRKKIWKWSTSISKRF